MVINIGALKSGDLRGLEGDIEAASRRAATRRHVKVIIEAALLTDQEKRRPLQAPTRASARCRLPGSA
jgi:deoxyribose-phosphate aldolase